MIFGQQCLYKQLIGKDCNFVSQGHKTSCSYQLLEKKSGTKQSEVPGVQYSSGEKNPNCI